MKPVTRRYHFDVDGVAQGDSTFLKMKYPYTDPPIDDGKLSGRSYAHIFGARTSAIENLIMKKRLMGPCWLKLTGVKPHDTSQAKVIRV
jgi:DNA polymerase alpha subunit A